MTRKLKLTALATAFFVFSFSYVSASPLQNTAPAKLAVEREVTFETEDGWTIHGVMSMPVNRAQGEKIPGVVMIPDPAHDQDIYGNTGYPSLRSHLEKANIATLRIDIRGRGKSAGRQEYHLMSRDQRARVALDVTGAIEYLSRREEIDSNRMGVVAEGESAEAAVAASFRDQRVRAVVLLSGRISEDTKKLIAPRDDVALYCVVSKEDKTSLIDMVDAYRLSENPASDLKVYQDIGINYAMFIMWAAKFPNEKPLDVTVAEWFIPQLQLSTLSREVTFQSEDGWMLSGTYRLPHGNKDRKAPGIVMVHSNLSDRHVFDNLERMLADAGFAVLNFDFRGRGKSKSKGSYFDLSKQEQDKGYLDVKAALDFLASQKEVDASRFAIVATSVGIRYGLKAANMDARVKSFVMLGGLPERSEVEKGRFPILFVSSLGISQIANAFREFHQITKDRGSHLVEFEGGGIGYHLFKLDNTLQPLVVRWLKPQFDLE